ncbi:MAG TPA: LysR family transcriptional regulator [Ramlibacter sp.]|nr:LysR family transcriptional regulator [Ramlibacter sp.]
MTPNSAPVPPGPPGAPARRPALDVRHLRLVQAVAREGSVTRAAPWLHLTQSALSHQLIDLERELGCRLFDRIGKRMVLTGAGSTLLEAAQTVLATLADAEGRLREGQTQRVPLRVAAGCFSYFAWVAPAMASFCAARPGLDAQIALHATRHEIQAVLQDEADVAVTATPSSDPRLVATPLFELPVEVLVAAGHRFARRIALTWQDLRGETLLTNDLAEHEYEKLSAAVGGRPAARIWQAQLTDAILELVRAGHGVGLLTRWPGSVPLGSGLSWRPLAPPQRRQFWAVSRRDNPRALPLQEFAEAIAATFTAAQATPRARRQS